MGTRDSRLTVLGMILLGAHLLGAAARAELPFAQPHRSLGEIRTGSWLTERFAFTNRGKEAVEITDIRASCGCLTPRLEKRVYQPGEEGKLTVEVNTLSQPAGPHTWKVQVFHRAGDQAAETQLYLAGTVIAEITVQPAAVTVFADRAVRYDIVLTDHRTRTLTVTAVQTSSPALKAHVGAAGRDADGHGCYKITLEVGDDYPAGRREEAVSIVTDDLQYRNLKVPVTVVKRASQRLSITPGEVRLVAATGQPIPSKIVLVRDSQEQPVLVDKVVADDPALVCTWAQGPNDLATVKVGADRARLAGRTLRSAVHIHVRAPVALTLTIPVVIEEALEPPPRTP